MLEVTHLQDDNTQGSLRWAIHELNEGRDNTITFYVSGVISLTKDLPRIHRSSIIANQNSEPVIIDGNLQVEYGLYWDECTMPSHVTGITITQCKYGFYFHKNVGHVIILNVAHHNHVGFYIEESTNNAIHENKAEHNLRAGFHSVKSNGNSFKANIANENECTGFMLTDQSSNNTFYGNHAKQNKQSGFIFHNNCNNNLMQNNVATENAEIGFALLDGCSNNILNYNDASKNKEFGFYLADSRDNQLYSNQAHDNTEYGFAVGPKSEKNNYSLNFSRKEGKTLQDKVLGVPLKEFDLELFEPTEELPLADAVSEDDAFIKEVLQTEEELNQDESLVKKLASLPPLPLKHKGKSFKLGPRMTPKEINLNRNIHQELANTSSLNLVKDIKQKLQQGKSLVKLQASSLSLDKTDYSAEEELFLGAGLMPEEIPDIEEQFHQEYLSSEDDMQIQFEEEYTNNRGLESKIDLTDQRNDLSVNRLFIKRAMLSKCRREHKQSENLKRKCAEELLQNILEEDVQINACAVTSEEDQSTETAIMNTRLIESYIDDEHYLVLSYLEEEEKKDDDLLCISISGQDKRCKKKGRLGRFFEWLF